MSFIINTMGNETSSFFAGKRKYVDMGAYEDNDYYSDRSIQRRADARQLRRALSEAATDSVVWHAPTGYASMVAAREARNNPNPNINNYVYRSPEEPEIPLSPETLFYNESLIDDVKHSESPSESSQSLDTTLTNPTQIIPNLQDRYVTPESVWDRYDRRLFREDTPLKWAIRNNRLDMARDLLQLNLDHGRGNGVDIRSEPLYWLVEHYFTGDTVDDELIQSLVHAGISQYMLDMILEYAITMNWPGYPVLVNMGADINRVDPLSGQTPIYNAIRLGKGDVIRRMISAGANLSHRDLQGRTPWDTADPLTRSEIWLHPERY